MQSYFCSERSDSLSVNEELQQNNIESLVDDFIYSVHNDVFAGNLRDCSSAPVLHSNPAVNNLSECVELQKV